MASTPSDATSPTKGETSKPLARPSLLRGDGISAVIGGAEPSHRSSVSFCCAVRVRWLARYL